MSDEAAPTFGNPVAPWHRWFAWHPVDTFDRGWKWLCFVERRRIQKHCYLDGCPSRWWQHRSSRKTDAMSDDTTQAMAKFVRWAMNCVWDDEIPDGFELQDKAQQLGLIVSKRDDDWFVLSPDILAALKSEG